MLLLTGLAHATVLRHALVVGANVGGAGLEPLHYAESDARRFSDVLVELGGFDPVYITVLYSPTEAELQEAIHAHADVASGFDDDLFLFYYSGHADARGLRIGADSYPWDELRKDIRTMPAEVKVGVLDACRSGSITRLKGAALSQPFLVDDRLAAEGEAWLTAANADEEAQESEALRGSFFTHYLMSGMRGAADTNDGSVSLQEAYDYAYARTVSHTGETTAGIQHPSFDYRIQGQGSLELTQVANGRAEATLPAELAGLITVVRRTDRTPVAEVAKLAGTPVTLALVPDTYLMRYMEGKTLMQAEVMLTDGARVTVSQFGPAQVAASASKSSDSGGAATALTVPPAPTPNGVVISDPVKELLRSAATENQAWWTEALNARDLRKSPLLATGLSTLVPGAGQMYNHQYVKGGLLMAGTLALFGGSVFVPDEGFFSGSITGPDPLALGAAMLYGVAIADAAVNAHPGPESEVRHPAGGGTIATYAGWDPSVSFGSPYVAGLSGDWLVSPNVSLGIDRLGWTRNSATESRWNFGSRVSFVVNGDKWRPYAFAAGGGRVIQSGGLEAVSDWADDETIRKSRSPVTSRLVGVVGAGVGVNYYVTPRYFLSTEMRVEAEDAAPRVLMGGGVGVHLGK